MVAVVFSSFGFTPLTLLAALTFRLVLLICISGHRVLQQNTMQVTFQTHSMLRA